MKVFWAFIAILVLTAAVMALRPSGDAKPERTAQAPPTPIAPTPRPTPSVPSALPAADPAPIPAPAAPTTVTAPTTIAAAPDPVPTPAEPAEVSPFGTPVPSSPEPDVAAAATLAQDPAPADPELPDVLQKLVTDTMNPTAPEPAEASNPEVPGPAAETPAAAAVTEPSAELPAEAASAAAAPLPATTIVKQADGSQLIDDRFILRGDGTKEKPYEVTWDFLVAAQEVYKPRLGQKTLPGYLEIIDGAYVKIAGYIAFPLMAQSPDEMLMMLNQWDGCCIGIPPTPYDAIEVRLRDAAEGDTRFKVTGSLVGKIAVDPYLVKDWLIGLYTMDDAVLTTEN